MGTESGVKSLQDAISKSLVELTRTTGQLAAEDLEFFRVSCPKESRQLDKSSSKILHLSRRLLQNAAKGTTIDIPGFSSAESLDDSWHSVVEVVDNLLEKTDIALDEFTGNITKTAAEPSSTKPIEEARVPYSKRSALPKPQLTFTKPPLHQTLGAFKPLLTTKPHALIPLEQSLSAPPTSDDNDQYRHPYQTEIERYDYPASVRSYRDPTTYPDFTTTEATFVDTTAAMRDMLMELKQATEIAIDLEHHDKHTYIGLVSLMQISTRGKDWIIDTLKPWREELQVLNEVFANPSILKVLHGAHSDIVWLQRDLGLYIVGLFDTYHAAVALQYPARSLAYLLDKFTGVKAQKQYQLADWRIRPLPPSLIDYARSDTHYLLYIYDLIRNELVSLAAKLPPAENPINEVLQQSKKESLQRFELRRYDAPYGTGPDGWYQMLMRTPALFNKQQFAVFRAVHQWRDEVARHDDESVNFVMLKQTLFNIARQLPTTMTALHNCASPMSEVMLGRIEELLSVVQEAIVAGEHGPEMKPLMDEHPETIQWNAAKAERARIRQEQRNQRIGVGAVVRRVREESNAIPLELIQTRSSSFWGCTIDDGLKGRPDGFASSPRLDVPLPPNATGVQTEEVDELPIEIEQEPSAVSAASAETSAREEVIVLRRSQKRKGSPTLEQPGDGGAAVPVAAEPPPSDVVALEDTVTMHEAKRRRQAAQKERQRERRASGQDAEAAFDYAAVPSVLHAKGSKDNAAKGINPYAKATDTSKGARKRVKDIAGKSFTYKG